MGIQDREYYRRDGPSFLETINRWGVVCKWLIITNVIAFVIQLLTAGPFGQSPFTDAFLLNVGKVMQGQVWRLVTHAFLHDPNSIWHILFNMLVLWWFGTYIEDLLRPKEFLAFYLVAAVMGGVAFTLENVFTGEYSARALGASGAVNGVLVLCALHYPRKIINLFMILPVPIWAFVAVKLAMDVFGLLGAGGMGRVAFSAHLGGALFALIYYKANIRLLNLVPDFQGWWKRRQRPQLRIYRDEPEAALAAPAPSRKVDEQLEAKMDAVLEKMQRFGKNSLTDSENEILQRASEEMRRRRS